MYSPEVELTEIFVSNIFNGNGFDKMQILDSEPVHLESGSLDQ